MENSIAKQLLETGKYSDIILNLKGTEKYYNLHSIALKKCNSLAPYLSENFLSIPPMKSNEITYFENFIKLLYTENFIDAFKDIKTVVELTKLCALFSYNEGLHRCEQYLIDHCTSINLSIIKELIDSLPQLKRLKKTHDGYYLFVEYDQVSNR